ncbi:MAG: ABC transporter ATP-binding protein [Roseburia sp.]|nr:ABC transporter ATP-binding protein [Roseburia sp.]
MEMQSAIIATNIKKKYKGFTLDIPQCRIPKGFATALIGENGAGKSTFLNILAGIRLDFKGDIRYFDEQEPDVEKVKERLGYTGPGCYFLPNWNITQVKEISGLLFDTFDAKRYEQLCGELGIGDGDGLKKVSGLSDGNRMKLTLAAVLSRETECLLMDEPASPLDPLMRDKLCEIIRDYLAAGQGEHTVFFSTHNISDMENVTDYCMIMENGSIVEEGFVEDLKEKYVLVKGERKDAEAAKKVLYSFSGNSYGFEGICLAENLDKLAGMDISVERPSLSQISVAVMKANTKLYFG